VVSGGPSVSFQFHSGDRATMTLANGVRVGLRRFGF